MKKNKILRLIGILSLLLSFLLMFLYNIPTLHEEVIKFDSTYKDKDVTLEATYYEVENSEYAVLICPGYSCDRQKWRPFSDLYVKNGITVMVFDYSGQGASTGVIGFDNAKTDNIPKEIDDAIRVLHEKSGIPYDHIILQGHSMGGRSILRLLQDYNNLDADTLVTEKKDIKNVILISPEVNYDFNAQASLFAGTSDMNEEPWKSYNEEYIKGTNVYLFGSTADDVVNDFDILAIYKRLGGKNAPEKGIFEGSSINNVGSKLTVGITPGVLHSYQMYSQKFTTFVNSAIKDITKNDPKFIAPSILCIYMSWVLALLGLFLTLYSFNKNYEYVMNDTVPTIVNINKFLWQKLAMWLPGLVIAFIVCSISVIMPFGSPIMNIPYMCFISGYGIFMLIYYSLKKKKNVIGRLPKFSFKANVYKKELPLILIVSLGLIIFTWYILWGSMYRLVPGNYRLFWMVFCSSLMTIGYFVSGVESDMLEKANATKKQTFFYSLIQYVPLFLFALFYAVIKSYSGLIGQVQNLILMYIFCIPLGEFVKKRTHSRALGAIITAFTFQTMMITSAALISFF